MTTYLTDEYLLLPFVEKTDFLYTSYGLIPNIITLFNSLIVSNFILYFWIISNHILSTFFLFTRLILDGTDGYIARKYNLYSKEGDIYDHISDSVFLGYIFYIIFYKLYLPQEYLLVVSNSVIIISVILNYEKSLYFLGEKIFGSGGLYTGYCTLSYIIIQLFIIYIDLIL
tara:strand:+ start:447 stop:959 length:513 start_codon:yes stop_codon:yes gene_type:complete